MSGDEVMTVDFFWWFILAAFVGLGVYALVGYFREIREARAARWLERRPRPHRWLPVHPHCRTWGHKYRAHQTVWLCGVCGDRIPRDTIEESA